MGEIECNQFKGKWLQGQPLLGCGNFQDRHFPYLPVKNSLLKYAPYPVRGDFSAAYADSFLKAVPISYRA